MLGRLCEMERRTSNMEYELEEELRPSLEQAEAEAQEHMERINAAKQRYCNRLYVYSEWVVT